MSEQGHEHMQLCHMWSYQWGCIVVDQQCRESNGKAKIEGYMRVSFFFSLNYCAIRVIPYSTHYTSDL